MFSIKEIDYDTEQDAEQVFSRLTWAVEKVDGLAGQLISNVTVDTNRSWVGVYDKNKMEFGLIEPRGVFSLKFFQIIVRGKISTKENKTLVNIRLRLGWYTFLTFLMLYLMTALMIATIISDGKTEDIWKTIVWLLVFPTFGTILLNWELNRIEKKIEGLFGFE